MLIAVSPYHLTTREAPAMAALLLADQVLTLVPAPAHDGSPEAAHAAGARIPSYLRFMSTWSWTAPLWKAGVIVSELEGQNAVDDMHAVSSQVDQDEQLAPLRRFMHHDLYEDERAYLSAVAADLLKGGPDPGINVPVAAGLDRFATRHQIMVARAQPTSVVQVAEARMSESLGAVALPILLQADADRLLHAREVLADAVEALWDAYEGVEEPEGAEGLRQAAGVYTDAYQSRYDELMEGSEDDEVRVVEGTVTISAMRMPADVVLRSSLAAMAGMNLVPRSPEPSTLPAKYDPYAGRSFISLLVKPLGARSAARRA
jgi:hypothetical protein